MTQQEVELFCKKLRDRFAATGINVIVQQHYYTETEVRNNPNKLYVFGDNLLRVGTGGQACIRDCGNSFGLATKESPNMFDNSFFSDSIRTLSYVFKDIESLVVRCELRRPAYVVFPADGLGTGLAQMHIRAPEAFKVMLQCLNDIFGLSYVTPQN